MAAERPCLSVQMQSRRGLVSVPSHQDHRVPVCWSLILCEHSCAGDSAVAQLLATAARCQGQGFASSSQTGLPEPRPQRQEGGLGTELVRQGLCLTVATQGSPGWDRGAVSLGSRTHSDLRKAGSHTPACVTFSPGSQSHASAVNEENSD